MKKILPILIIYAFLAPTIGSTILLIHYEVNKKQITQDFCINKNKPWMHCDGHCYFMQQIKKEKPKKNPLVIQRLDIQLICEKTEEFEIKNHISGIFHLPEYQSIKTQESPDKIFHPPTIA